MELLARDGGELRSFVGGLRSEIKQIGFSDRIGFHNRKVSRNPKTLGVTAIRVQLLRFYRNRNVRKS